MRRNYTREALIDAISTLKKAYPELEIGVQFIVGFPSESLDDFKDTCDLLRRIKFDYGQVFVYSDVEGTESSSMEPKINKKEKWRRLRYIYKILKKTNDRVWKTRYGLAFYNK